MRIIGAGLSDTLFTKVQQRVLSVIFGQPDRAFYGNEIIRLADVGVGAVMRELERLVASGLVMVTRSGNQKHYQANPDSPIFSELRSLVLKTFGVADVLRQALLPFADRIQVAFVYGSVAKGQDSASSDIDLMIVSGDLAYPDMFAALTEAEKQIGRTVNPTIYTQEELNKRLTDGNDFITRVLDQPKIFIVGTDNDIRQPG